MLGFTAFSCYFVSTEVLRSAPLRVRLTQHFTRPRLSACHRPQTPADQPVPCQSGIWGHLAGRQQPTAHLLSLFDLLIHAKKLLGPGKLVRILPTAADPHTAQPYIVPSSLDTSTGGRKSV